MKYLQFLKKMTDANANGGVDGLWQSLKNDERNYLLQNEARLSVLGGEKIFLHQLAEKFDVDTAGASELEVKKRLSNAINDLVEDARRRVQSNHDNQDEKEQAKLAQQELISDQRFATYIEAFSAVLSRGDGKSWEAINLGSAFSNHPVMKEIFPNSEDLLNSIILSGNAKLFHYLLHDSPDKNKYRSLALEGFPDEDKNFEPLKHELTLNILEHKNGQMLDDMFQLLSEKQKKVLFKKESQILIKYGKEVAAVALKYSPRDDIGKPHPRADEGGYYASQVRDQDEILVVIASWTNNPELLEYIFSCYNDPAQISSIIERNGAEALGKAVAGGHKECVDIILKKISDENRLKITSDQSFMRILRDAMSRHDVEMTKALMSVLPPEEDRTTLQKKEIILCQLRQNPEQIDSQALRSLLEAESSYSLQFVFQEGAQIGAPMLRKLVEAFPAEFLEYLKKPVNPSIIAEHRKEVLDSVPATMRTDAVAAMDAIGANYGTQSYDQSTHHNPTAWHAALGVSAHNLPQEILQQNPYNFNFDTYKQLLPLMQTACQIEGNEGAEQNAYN